MPLPGSWSALRKRQFEHIKASLVEQGHRPEKAAELAARTVNKARRAAGEVDEVRAAARSGPGRGARR